MRRIDVVERLTLDGVMQAPGSPNEDTRDGFQRGGWGIPYNDEVLGAAMSKGMGTSELLMGRRTYQILHDAWADRPDPNPFTKVLDDTQKYVVSRTLTEPLPWVNSTLLNGDAPAAVTELKQGKGKDLTIMGSGQLVRALMAADLIDGLTLLIHPLVLGSGRRLFDGDVPPTTLKLTGATPTPSGVVIASYGRA